MVRRINCALLIFSLIFSACASRNKTIRIIDIDGMHQIEENQVWLSHEHLLVDFIGADSIQPKSWDHADIMSTMIPRVLELNHYDVHYFVDATPNYLGRDVNLLKKIAEQSGLKILTNTGLYGARQNKFIPSWAFETNAKELAEKWIFEFKYGIAGTPIKPGFIKIGVDAAAPLNKMHAKLVEAAALTHLKSGLTIASHTGPAVGLWPQLEILEEQGVSAEAFIWVHAQNEQDHTQYLNAAEYGCWISLDGLGWEMDDHLKKLIFAKQNGILGQILISHDAGWYDPQKEIQEPKPFTNIFTQLIPALKKNGFDDQDINMLLSQNPANAFGIRIKTIEKPRE